MSWNGVKKQSYEQEIKSWCEEMGIEDYSINSQGEIDVDNHVEFEFKENNDFKELPYKFGKIDGYFSLQWCKNLISLKNCPDFVKGSFSCSFGKCIKSLEYCSKRVGGDFYCYNNKLTSLKGSPKTVDGNFKCHKNQKQFTKEEVEEVCNVGGEITI